MFRKSFKIHFLVAFCGVLSIPMVVADDHATYVNTALKSAEIQAAASMREWRDPTPLKLRLGVFREHQFSLAQLHDAALQFFTGYRNATLPKLEIAMVEIDAYADLNAPMNSATPQHQFYWRMIFGVQAVEGKSPEVFFSTKPFSGECGDPMTRVRPGRLLRIDGKLLLELKQEQSFHGCAGQKETVRHIAHLFNVEDRFREVFQYDELFFDGSNTAVAMLNPVVIGEYTGSSLLLQAISSPRVGPRKVVFDYLKWTGNGLLVPEKK